MNIDELQEFIAESKKADPAREQITPLTCGFHTLVFPPDLEMDNQPVKVMLLGINKTFFCDEFLELLRGDKTPCQVLFNLDGNCARTRARALGREEEDYLTANLISTRRFLKEFKGDHITFRYFNKYPFGLYMKVGSYTWFAPLWNVDIRGTAIRGPILQLPSSSQFGKFLENNFEHLWSEACPLMSNDFEAPKNK